MTIYKLIIKIIYLDKVIIVIFLIGCDMFILLLFLFTKYIFVMCSHAESLGDVLIVKEIKLFLYCGKNSSIRTGELPMGCL